MSSRDDDLAGLAPCRACLAGIEDVLADALVLGDEIPDAVILVDASDDFAIGALRARRRSRLRAGRACRADHARAVARSPCSALCISLRRKEQVGAAVVGDEKAEAVGMALHRAGDQIELGDDAKLALAIGHELTVAFHRREAPIERLALRVSPTRSARRASSGARARRARAGARGWLRGRECRRRYATCRCVLARDAGASLRGSFLEGSFFDNAYCLS